MSQYRIFTVLLFGLTDFEREVVKRIFFLTRQRSRRYQIVRSQNIEKANIVIVDAFHLKEFENIRVVAGYTSVPMITLENTGFKQHIKGDLKRPINAQMLISLLDRITIKHYQFVPELVINDSAAPEDLDKNLQDIIATIDKSDSRALVVDDSLSARVKMSLELELYGLHVDLAENAEQALSYANSRSYAIIFLDVSLNEDSDGGFTLCKLLKSDIGLRNTPVCMLTGKTSPISKVKGAMSGCDAYLTKPVDSEKLRNVMTRMVLEPIRQKQAPDQSREIPSHLSVIE